MSNYNFYLTKIDTGTITTDDTDNGFEELENNNEVTLEEWFENLDNKNTNNSSGTYLGLIIILFLTITLVYIKKRK